jgi:hypothetical protein
VFVQAPGRVQLAAGLDFRASSHDRVEDSWRVDFEDRSVRRPRLAVRRLAATIERGRLTVDVGKQFIRWGRTDILNPVDRFAPRDFLDVIDAPFLPVLAVRPTIQIGDERFEAVWTPQMTPSRIPLPGDRWFPLPQEIPVIPFTAAPITPPVILDAGSLIPRGSQLGVRWNHTGTLIEASAMFFDGFNYLPGVDVRVLSESAVELRRVYPELRAVGGDLALPLRWLTLKAEAAFFDSPPDVVDDYVLYVVEVERQVGEWSLIGGYVGEVVTKRSGPVGFAPDRGIAGSVLGRAAYTVDPQRTVALEGVVRQSGAGMYLRGEFSQALGSRWRLILSGVGLAGDESDFLGQYDTNSHVSATLRFNF